MAWMSVRHGVAREQEFTGEAILELDRELGLGQTDWTDTTGT